MDPNELLKKIRTSVQYILNSTGDIREDKVNDLAGWVDDLDEWITKGGLLPQAWNHYTHTEEIS